ncbi:MAG: divalent-cation tolerance protein CutA [Thermoproteota archaeon]
MAGYIQVFTATGRKEDAERIARTLLEARLAACIQILGPASSMYWWRGRLESAEEWICVIKSMEDKYEELERVIRINHPYEVPEIIAVKITAGSSDYLKWLESELGGGRAKD